MKHCPTCQRTYPDDAPAFCTNDGTRLVAEESSEPFDPQKTVLASAPPPSPPQQQYSAPAPQNNPQPPVPQHQQAWQTPPPQQQAQNWGGGYYQQQPQAQQWPPQYAPSAGSKSLTLTTLIVGVISALAIALIFAMVRGLVTPDRDVAKIAYYGSAGLGVVALVLGIIALISKRQRSKWMAIVGLILGLPAIALFIYVEFFRNGF